MQSGREFNLSLLTVLLVSKFKLSFLVLFVKKTYCAILNSTVNTDKPQSCHLQLLLKTCAITSF